jgi:hypothetical protein
MHKYLFLLSIFLFSVTATWAQPAPALGGAAVLSGGIGEESMRELLPRQRGYNLKLVFTLLEGDYVADVSVNIADAGGRKVVEHFSQGPVLLARLPAGNYVATLTYRDVTQTHRLTLRDRGLRSTQVRWKRSEADGAPLL